MVGTKRTKKAPAEGLDAAEAKKRAEELFALDNLERVVSNTVPGATSSTSISSPSRPADYLRLLSLETVDLPEGPGLHRGDFAMMKIGDEEGQINFSLCSAMFELKTIAPPAELPKDFRGLSWVSVGIPESTSFTKGDEVAPYEELDEARSTVAAPYAEVEEAFRKRGVYLPAMQAVERLYRGVSRGLHSRRQRSLKEAICGRVYGTDFELPFNSGATFKESSTRAMTSVVGLLPALALLELIDNKEKGLPALPPSDVYVTFSPGSRVESAEVVFVEGQREIRGRLEGLDKEPLRVYQRLQQTLLELEAMRPEFEAGSLVRQAQIGYRAETLVQETALPDYLELLKHLQKRKPDFLQAHQAYETKSRLAEASRLPAEVRRGLAKLPNNMDKLPAHFAAIPAGLEDLEETVDARGFRRLVVKRPNLVVGDQKARPIRQMEFPLAPTYDNDTPPEQALESIKRLLRNGGPRWLIPQGLVAISKLYQDAGGLSNAGGVEIRVNDWIDTMRPDQVERFKKKGRGDAFAGQGDPSKLFVDLLNLLDKITYISDADTTKYQDGKLRHLEGFYKVNAYTTNDLDKITSANISLNPLLTEFLTGQGGLPYMVTNARAMFSYRAQALDHAPAAQLAVEQLARMRIYSSDTAELLLNGEGITRLEMAARFGLVKTAKIQPAALLRQLNGIFEALAAAGVLADMPAVNGRDKTGGDAFGVQLVLRMHEDYVKAYRESRAHADKIAAERGLAKALGTPRRSKKA